MFFYTIKIVLFMTTCFFKILEIIAYNLLIEQLAGNIIYIKYPIIRCILSGI